MSENSTAVSSVNAAEQTALPTSGDEITPTDGDASPVLESFPPPSEPVDAGDSSPPPPTTPDFANANPFLSSPQITTAVFSTDSDGKEGESEDEQNDDPSPLPEGDQQFLNASSATAGVTPRSESEERFSEISLGGDGESRRSVDVESSPAPSSTRPVFINKALQIDDELCPPPNTPADGGFLTGKAQHQIDEEDMDVIHTKLSMNAADTPSSDGSSAADDTPSSDRPDVIIAGVGGSSLRKMSTTVVHSSTETDEETFERLAVGLADGSISHKDLVNSVFQTLVGGSFDAENKFIIQNSNCILRMVDLLKQCSPKLQAEIWSVFIAVVRKSNRNLASCAEVGLISIILDLLRDADLIIADLFVELLGILSSYSVNVKEIKKCLKYLKVEDDVWPCNAAKLLQVMKQMPKRDGPDVFFSFSGNKGAGVVLPPIKQWPYQNGWTFSTWLRMDPMNSVNFEKERPYIYCFRTSKGVGYSLHLTGNCLVVTAMKVRSGRGYTRCVGKELASRRWHHVAISHLYSRWGKSQVQCFVNGHLTESMDMNWHVATTDFDRCYIGGGPEGDADTTFCGQMGAVYCFAQAISLQQANSLYCLGPAYQSQFKYDAECQLPEGYKKHLFDGQLNGSLMMAYCPKNCDRQLCLDSTPRENPSYFVHTPHAVMREDVTVVHTHSVHSSLHSIGGIQTLLPLFKQLDCPHAVKDGSSAVDYTICSTLLAVISLLLETSPSSQHELFQNKGFLVISNALQMSSKEHLTSEVLESLLGMAKFLLSVPAGIPLLKQLFDFILLNPKLWIHTPANVQLRLYGYLANEFLSSAAFHSTIRRTSTVIQMLHALKYFYWVVDPSHRSGIQPKGVDGNRPAKGEIVQIRSFILTFVKKLLLKTDSNRESKDDEFQALLNYIATVNEDDNLYDVLQCAIALMAEDPASMVPAFDRRRGVQLVFKLVASENELIRLPGLKLLGYFLCRATIKRKQDVMGPENLFTLLTDRLLLNASHLTMATYNALYEILVEKMNPQAIYTKHTDTDEEARFENPMVLKVVANLISQSQSCSELIEVKKVFLADMSRLCANSKENRRTVLQMSVWQEWLIGLAYVFPENDTEVQLSSGVHRLFGTLLHHAIAVEYGGWRVWVDTLAIVHSKVCWEHFRRDMAAQKSRAFGSRTSSSSALSKQRSAGTLRHSAGEESVEATVKDTLSAIVDRVCSEQEKPTAAPKLQKTENAVEKPSSIYRTPEFRWSAIHLRLLSDLLTAIEGDVAEWKRHSSPANGVTSALVEAVNSNEHQVMVINVVHVLSQLSDTLIMACGGLLPLLAAATSPNSELEIGDASHQGLSIENAATVLIRFVSLADTFVFSSAISFAELEQEKNLPSGAILRQMLRLVATIAVRGILACRFDPSSPAFVAPPNSADPLTPKQQTRRDAISKFINAGKEPKFQSLVDILEKAAPISDAEHLLQETDLSRLKATIYRDMEETRQAQFLALAVTYLLSVLMVSRYRDILEPPTSPSPFFDTTKRRSTTGDDPSTGNSDGRLVNGDSASTEQKEGAEEVFDESTDATVAAVHRRPTEEPISNGTDGETKANTTATAQQQSTVSSISIKTSVPPSAVTQQGGDYKHDELKTIQGSQKAPRLSASSMPKERQERLTTKLQKALESCSPLFREIMTDFRSFMQRTLLGTHGQHIMNDNRVQMTLKNPQGSVIELVMLLCSQEWQTSLQKHAGLAFIELVNEGRLMAHATREHILRVANEADFILNRLRAEDVSKHAEFETSCAETLYSRREEEKACDHLIGAARRRDCGVAFRILDKITYILTSSHGAWHQIDDDNKRTLWRLDVWEDDSRRRKRFIPNPYGSSHPEATLKAAVQHGASAEDVEKAREALLKHLVGKKIISPTQLQGTSSLADLVDESDIATWTATEMENEAQQAAADALQQTSAASCTVFARLIAPGLAVPGTVSITSNELFFDCDEEHPEYKLLDPKVLRYCDNLHGRWHFQEIRAIFLRRYIMQNTALELFLASRTAIMFAFVDRAAVKKVVQHLPRVGVGVKYGLPQSRKASLMSPRQLFKHSDMSQKWQRREISNFDYLMFLNTVAGRTYNDLNQYPVFPWVLANYESSELDLSQPSNFRDLSKPIGALTQSRKKYFEKRYTAWDHESIPPFHYGTHYSTPAFTLNWLLRIEPFTTMFLSLQSGKFDVADRLFNSMAESWQACQRNSHDVKELIPELFFMPEMFRNSNEYQLGKRQDDIQLGHVALPAWASSPEQFIQMHRQALESDLVSCQLHQWIDLIFGYKQRGPEAVRATNVFYYLTYEGALDLSAIEDEAIRLGLENQLKNFGLTPAQLMVDPHPPRQSVMTIVKSPMMFHPVTEDLCMVMKFISNSPVVHLSANTYAQLSQPSVVSIAANLGFAVNRWNNHYSGAQSSQSTLQNATAEQQQRLQAVTQPVEATSHSLPNLPLTVDPLLASGNPAAPISKRHLGDSFDQRLMIRWSNFITTVDSKIIFACGYPDYSFRVIETDTGRVRQVVHGHRAVVTCLARSECNLFADCYVASGSADCTVLLWHWNSQTNAIAGEYNLIGEQPAARAILTGHDSEIVSIVVSAEHGLVLSGSNDGVVLVHTTQGDLLRCLTPPPATVANADGTSCNVSPSTMLMSRECLVACCYQKKHLILYAVTGRPLAHIDVQPGLECACLSRDGEYLVTGSDDGIVRIYRLFGLTPLYSFNQCDSAVKSVTISQNHRFILAGLGSGAIVVFNVDFNKWHYEYRNRTPQR